MNIKRITSAIGLAFGVAMAVPALASAATIVTPTNFNTHSGADYKGINVGFTVSGDALTSVKVELLDDGEVLVTNTGTALLNSLYNGTGPAVELSTPFITFHGTYGADPYWTFGEWSELTTPDTARITVNGTVVATNTNLVEPNGWTFNTLLPQLNGENFNTHAGADYEGVNVGFNVDGFEELESVTVKLLDASGKVLVTNTGTDDLFALYASGETQFSTPFITKDLTYNAQSDTYWNFGNWSSFAKPATAVVTVNGQTVSITPLTEPNGITWASIVPPAPTTKEACKNGGWEGYYKNQGQCVSSFASKNKNVTTNTNTVSITNTNTQSATSGSANSRGGGNANSGNANNSIVTTIRLAFSQLF